MGKGEGPGVETRLEPKKNKPHHFILTFDIISASNAHRNGITKLSRDPTPFRMIRSGG